MKLLNIQVKNRKNKSSRNKGRGSKQQFQINSEISFDVDKSYWYAKHGNRDDLKRYFTLMSSKLKKNIKLIKLLDRFLVG